MFSVDGIRTLANIIIVNPIQMDLVSCVVLFRHVTMTLMAQTKEGLYQDHTL
jgi:hypothetical protein